MERIQENNSDASDVTFDEFMTVMKYAGDARDFYDILEAHPEYVNQQNKDGKTALMIAAENGYGDSVATLIESHDADVFLKDKQGKTAAQLWKDYHAENPGELDEEGMKFFMNVFEKKVRPVAQKTTGLDVVSRQKQMGKLDKLPKDTLDRIAAMTTGQPGTIEQQRQTMKQAVGKGRKRKARKTRRKNQRRRV